MRGRRGWRLLRLRTWRRHGDGGGNDGNGGSCRHGRRGSAAKPSLGGSPHLLATKGGQPVAQGWGCLLNNASVTSGSCGDRLAGHSRRWSGWRPGSATGGRSGGVESAPQRRGSAGSRRRRGWRRGGAGSGLGVPCRRAKRGQAIAHAHDVDRRCAPLLLRCPLLHLHCLLAEHRLAPLRLQHLHLLAFELLDGDERLGLVELATVQSQQLRVRAERAGEDGAGRVFEC